jgi:hypothetical protein
MKATGAIMNDAAVVVSADPKKVKGKNTKLVDQDLSPSSEDGDVASKLSDLSESSTDNGLQRHDDMMMMDHTASSNNNNNNNKSNKNKHKLRSERSEDYENFEKMLRNKHSKACKAMSVRRAVCLRHVSFRPVSMYFCFSRCVVVFKRTFFFFFSRRVRTARH